MNIVCFGDYANVVTVHQWDALENACHQSTNPIRASKHLRRSHPESDQSWTRINANYINLYISRRFSLKTKFAVIWVKRRQKASFLSPKSSKITVTKKKERRKRKSEEKKKNNGCTISFYNSYFGDDFWPKENCWTQKVHLAITLSKIRIADYNCTRNSNIFKNISLSN